LADGFYLVALVVAAASGGLAGISCSRVDHIRCAAAAADSGSLAGINISNGEVNSTEQQKKQAAVTEQLRVHNNCRQK